MKAAVYRGRGDLRVEEIPVPEPGPGEMLVKVDVCGVCLTDVKKIEKGLLPGPRVFGHEIAGTVAARGTGVSRFREGDRVVVHHHVPCRDCFYCGVGAYAQCATYKRNGTTAGFEPSGGGFAEYVKAMPWIVERGAIAIPAGVSAEVASFVEPVNTCLKGIRKAGIRGGESALVVGQGPIGLILMQLARWAGAAAWASDPMEDRRQMSRRLGAAGVLDPAAGDVPEQMRAATAGRGVDVAILAAGGPAPFAQALAATRPGGRVLIFAATAPGETAEVDLGALTVSEKDVLTSYSASVDVQDLAAELVFTGQVRVAELVTHRFPLTEAPRAVDLAARPAPGVLKVVVEAGRS
ncbi:MAG TPA: alcohol dehydrogenase catalytic domain-containing protein [Vicinamibacteria bacterium]